MKDNNKRIIRREINRRVWMKDIMDWTGLGKHIMVKRAAEERAIWRVIVVNLRYRHEDDK